jgi:putative SOS response-associated peptidase YedK
MGGRSGIADVRHLGERFRLSLDLDLTGIAPRYHAAPTQRLPVIVEREPTPAPADAMGVPAPRRRAGHDR